MRGTAAGLLTAALTVAAHSVGGGGLPFGVDVVALGVVAVTVGAVLASASRGGDVRILAVVLAAGQVAGHAVLAAPGHLHAAAALPAWSMVTAHVVAVVAGAALIGIGEHLARALSRVVPSAAPAGAAPIASSRQPVARSSDHPLLSTLLLASSMSHRGPPVSTR